jgi:uncharacterized protein (DUF433 family)
MNAKANPTEFPHIVRSLDGHLRIERTWHKVRLIIEAHLAGMSVEDILEAYVPKLTRAEVLTALAYYHDHKEELDGEIAALRAAEEKAIAEGRVKIFTREELLRRYKERTGRDFVPAEERPES